MSVQCKPHTSRMQQQRLAFGSHSTPVKRLQNKFNQPISFTPPPVNQAQSVPQVQTVPSSPRKERSRSELFSPLIQSRSSSAERAGSELWSPQQLAFESQSFPVNQLQSTFNQGASTTLQSVNQVQSVPQVRTVPTSSVSGLYGTMARISPQSLPQAQSLPVASSQNLGLQTSYQQGYSPALQGQVKNSQMPQAQMGGFSLQGLKPNNPNWVNQDTHLELNLSGGKMLLGVFDGHGPQGTHVANRVKSIFTEQAHAIASASDVRGAFHGVFTQACNQIRNDPAGQESGTTATVALVDTAAQRVSIANAGDSTAIVIDPRGSIVFASQDHKASNESEAQRLRARGATVQNGRVIAKSLNPQYASEATLALARAIGDFQFAPQGVNGEPDIVPAVKFEPGSYLVIASDGVWDVVPRDEASRTMSQFTPQDAAQQLVNVARSNWMNNHASSDDITAVAAKSAPNEFDQTCKKWQNLSSTAFNSFMGNSGARLKGA